MSAPPIPGLISSETLKEYGVVKWGYTEEAEAQSFKHYETWVQRGGHGSLNYLADHRMEMRKSLKTYWPKSSSALVFLFSYASTKKALDQFFQSSKSNGHRMASYVFGFDGDDYHYVLKDRLNEIAQQICSHFKDKDISFKLSLDVHPVLDRDLAYRAGLGWFGKNSMLIDTKEGSYTLIGSILFDQKLDLQTPKTLEADHCGSCQACVDACPTDAIDPSRRQILANLCISTFTIELFDSAKEIEGHLEKSQGEIFGCDICQDVCPWNIRLLSKIEGQSKNLETEGGKLLVDNFLMPPRKSIWEKLLSMSNKGYVKLFKRTPLARTGRKGMLKNLKIFNL